MTIEEKYQLLLNFVKSSTMSGMSDETLKDMSECDMQAAADGGNFDDAFSMGQTQADSWNAIQARELLDEIGETYS